MKIISFVLNIADKRTEELGTSAKYLGISGLCPDVSPEKLKFYACACFDNVVTDMWFNIKHTGAVIEFLKPIGIHYVHQTTKCFLYKRSVKHSLEHG